ETQIELALERVRARTMGMQNSEELQEVIKITYDQFIHLKINVEHTGFIVDYMEREDMHIWLADQNDAPSEISIPYFDSPHWNSFLEAKEKGNDFFINTLNFDEKNKFYQELFKFIPELSEEAKKFYFNCPGLAISTVLMENVGLYMENFSGIPYSDEDNAVLMRFGKVFQQTYTRFLDLQKAEAQAKEAQIETALEKIRNRTLLMKDSSELNEAVAVFFQQFKELELIPEDVRTYFSHVNTTNDTVEVWMTHADGSVMNGSHITPLKKSPELYEFYKKWKMNKEVVNVRTYKEDSLKKYMQFLATLPHVSMDEDYINLIEAPPEQIIMTDAGFSKGFLGIMSFVSLSEASIELLVRFAKVFEYTYTRFLYLKTAEAQAREAQVEAALERVRARTMAMHKSNELAQTAAHLFSQLNELGIKPYRCNIAIVEDESNTCQLWSTTNSGNVIPTSTSIPLDEHPIFIEMKNGWESKRRDHIIKFHGENRLLWTKYISQYVKFKEYKPKYIDEGKIKNEPAVFSIFYFNQGFFVIHTAEDMSSADFNVTQRFANVFEQTYIRFQDLERAE
ncbi:MAG: hypothetical protein R3250_15960, partial [Melioribacteraceae bacterium]|nr:hypothetical protein [Melioribacteraceae bacterium]